MADLPKKTIFYDFLEKNNIETGRAKVYYSFTGSTSGAVFLNSFTESPYQTGDGLSDIAIPGISVGKDDEIFTSSTDTDGSGHFNGSGAVLLGSEIDYSGWTVFMQVNDIGWLDAVSKPKILLSSMIDDTSFSGFNVGIDGSNHLYFQAPVDYTNNLTTLTTKEEVGGNILVSVAMGNQNSSLEMTIHDVPYGENHTSKFFNVGNIGLGQSTPTNPSHSWRIGNFKHGAGYTSPNYSGFSGDIESFILISGFVDETARNDLAKTFFISGYTPSQEVTSDVVRTIKTSTPFLESVFTGSGVTGQETGLIDTYSYPEGESRVNINLYRVTDLLAPLSGEQLGFHSSSEEVTGQATTFQPAVESYDTGVLYSGSKEAVSFRKGLTALDTIEVYSYITGTNNHNNVATKQGSRYEFDNEHSGEKTNVYKNGLLQAEKSRNLLSGGMTVDYAQYGASGTGIVQLTKASGIVSGQKYYVDFSYDYISGNVGSGSAVSLGNLGIGESMAVITGNTPADLREEFIGNIGTPIHTSGFVTAGRDGLTILHSGAHLAQISDSDKIHGGKTFVDIRLDYGGDYEIATDGKSFNSSFSPASPGAGTTGSNAFNQDDTVLYDKMTSGAAESKFFVYTGQTRTDGVYGKDSSNKLILKEYYLGETNTSDDEVFYEPYLNGKKLRSGEHYVLKPVGAEPEQMEFDTTSFISTGLIHIAPLTSGTKNFNQGSVAGTHSFIEPSFNVIDEQVWVEGVRQQREEQYEVVDSSSKKKTGKRIDNNGITNLIFSSNNEDATVGIEGS